MEARHAVYIDGIPVFVTEDGSFQLPGSPAPCHGYANLCSCKTCEAREKRALKLVPRAPRQPWEPIAA